MSPEQVRAAFADYIRHLNSLDPIEMLSAYAPNASGNEARRELFESFAAAFRTLVWEPQDVYIDGNTVANNYTARGTTAAGKVVTFDGIAVMTFNEDGKVATLRMFWDPEVIVAQMNE